MVYIHCVKFSLMVVYYLYDFVFFELYGDHRDLHVLTHSFPTRRSSDLQSNRSRRTAHIRLAVCGHNGLPRGEFLQQHHRWSRKSYRRGRGRVDFRSEEHTSELQSLMRISYAVFCLKKKNDARQRNLLEKLRTIHVINTTTQHRTPITTSPSIYYIFIQSHLLT